MNQIPSRALKKCTPEELNEFLDRIINQVEALVADVNDKNDELAKKEKEIIFRDEKIHRLAVETGELKRRLKHYEDIEEDLSKTKKLFTTESLKIQQERDAVLAEAQRNADKIVNEALLSAEKTEMEANLLKRNMRLLKNKMKKMIEEQLETHN